ncbi:MAG: glycosyltransferase family 2 protein, partial [Candidatus Binatia bacterium]
MTVPSSAETTFPPPDKSAPGASFAIATTLKQSPAHTKAYLHYHLNLAPDLFILFFDDPNDQAADYAADFKGTLVFRCDDAHWRRVHGGAPERMQQKQHANLNAALEICRERRISWLISVDADELIYPFDEIRKELALLPAEKDLLTLRPLEAVRHRSLNDDEPFSSIYHKVLPRPARMRLFELIARPDPNLTHLGFFGHVTGKAFHRVAATTRITSQHGSKGAIAAGKWRSSKATFLLHHDCVSYNEWKLKWSRRVSKDTVATRISDVRQRQHEFIEAVLARGGDGE